MADKAECCFCSPQTFPQDGSDLFQIFPVDGAEFVLFRDFSIDGADFFLMFPLDGADLFQMFPIDGADSIPNVPDR